MIFVDHLRPCGAPWRGGVSCHLVSDESEAELQGFAQGLGLPNHWLQRGTIPHYDLSPRLRARALAHGAVEVDRAGVVAALQRFRSRNPAARPAAR